jgi:hypothetical protein
MVDNGINYFSKAIFRRGQKQELFDNGEEGQFDEKKELEARLQGMHSVWSAPRSG